VSTEAISVVLHHSEATGVDRLVLIGIANHDGDGGAWPSIATLAKYAKCSARTVQRSLRVLEHMGEIRIRLQAGGDREWANNRRPNRYDLLVDCPESCAGGKKHEPRSGVTTVSPQGPETSSGVTDPALWGDNPVAAGVTTVSPKPSMEPPLNHPSMERPASRTPADVDALIDMVMDGLPKLEQMPGRAGIAAACRDLHPGWTPALLSDWVRGQDWRAAKPAVVVYRLRELGPPPVPRKAPVVRDECPEHPGEPAGRCDQCARRTVPPPASFRASARPPGRPAAAGRRPRDSSPAADAAGPAEARTRRPA
jgi:hypothetical protein